MLTYRTCLMVRLVAAVFLAISVGATPLAAKRKPIAAKHEPLTSRPITIGLAHEIASRALGERRTINVVLPASYAHESKKRYPVLYLIDGGVEQDLLHIAGAAQLGAVWGRSAEAIVVGIETKDRRRELTGATADLELLKRYPTAGSAARFRSFLRSEVKSLIEQLYRTSGHDALMGESLAGLFVVETYLLEPQLFDTYGAVDPSLWWDKGALSRAAADLRQSGRTSPLFFAIAREQAEDAAGARQIVSAVRARMLPVCVTVRRDLTHATIYQQVAPEVLQYLFPPASAAAEPYGFRLRCADEP